MTDDELIFVLERAHKFKTYGGNGYTPEGTAASRLRELIVQKEQLEDRITELLAIKNELNERLLNAQTEIQLLEARARNND